MPRNPFQAVINAVPQITDAIARTTDTFCNKPFVYQLGGESVERINRNRKDQTFTNYNLLGLIVWYTDKTDTDTMRNEGEGGIDFGEGYILLNIKDLREVKLLDENGNFIGKANTDYVLYQEEKIRVVGLPKAIGQLVDSVQVYKIFIRKIQKNG